jgi:hypothetical protein
MLHVDDTDLLALYRELVASPVPPDVGAHDPRRLAMLHFSLWGKDGKSYGIAEGFDRLWRNPRVLAELRQLLDVLDDRTDHLTYPLDIDVPLRAHASYTLAEVLTDLGRNVPGERWCQLQAGVLFDEPTRCDLFFVTTQKSERDYSPTTMYRDFALSPELFHWESQSATSADSDVGRRYQRHREVGTHVLSSSASATPTTAVSRPRTSASASPTTSATRASARWRSRGGSGGRCRRRCS